jgi:uncharacterized membrane protein YciS (DUF1049 family)
MKPSKANDIGEWDLSQEREFIENLLCQRFDFLLVFYSLVVAGAFSASSARNFMLSFMVGAIICSLLALSIARTQNKLELILKRIRVDKQHPATITDDNAWSEAPTGFKWLIGKSGRKIVGYVIPLICSLSLWTAFVLAWYGVLTP